MKEKRCTTKFSNLEVYTKVGVKEVYTVHLFSWIALLLQGLTIVDIYICKCYQICEKGSSTHIKLGSQSISWCSRHLQI